MFDRNVTVRAGDTHIEPHPHDTADAARLYGECLEKAREEMANQLAFDFQHSAVLIAGEITHDVALDIRRTWIIFKLNGETIKLRLADIDPNSLILSPEGEARAFCKAIAESITEQLLTKFAPGELRRLR
jgi:hypothetical protein